MIKKKFETDFIVSKALFGVAEPKQNKILLLLLLSSWVALTPYGAHFFRAKNAHFCDWFEEFSQTGLFRVAQYEFGSQIWKLKMADILWRTRNLKKLFDSDKNWYLGFVKVPGYKSTLKTSEIQYGGSRGKNYFIGMKMSSRGFSRSLIMNRHSKFENSIWRNKM